MYETVNVYMYVCLQVHAYIYTYMHIHLIKNSIVKSQYIKLCLVGIYARNIPPEAYGP